MVRSQPRSAARAVREGATRWIHDTQLAVNWGQHASVLVVRYERLVQHSSTELDRLFQFLGERFREADILACGNCDILSFLFLFFVGGNFASFWDHFWTTSLPQVLSLVPAPRTPC